MEVKLCVFCKHCGMGGGVWLSDVTWEDPTLSCLAHQQGPSDLNPFAARRWSQRAETCEKYEVADA